MSTIIKPSQPVSEVSPLTEEEQVLMAQFFETYYKKLMPIARAIWPKMSKEDREDAVSAFILSMCTKRKKNLKEWLSIENQGLVMLYFKRNQIDQYRKEKVRSRTTFDGGVIASSQVVLDPTVQKNETMEHIELIKQYVKRYCSARDYLIFSMAFIYGHKYSRRDIGSVFQISERVVNQRIYLIRVKLRKAGFLE